MKKEKEQLGCCVDELKVQLSTVDISGKDLNNVRAFDDRISANSGEESPSRNSNSGAADAGRPTAQAESSSGAAGDSTGHTLLEHQIVALSSRLEESQKQVLSERE